MAGKTAKKQNKAVSPVNGQPIPRGRQFTSETAREARRKRTEKEAAQKSITAAFMQYMGEVVATEKDGTTLTGAQAIAKSIIRGATKGNAEMVKIALAITGETPGADKAMDEVEIDPRVMAVYQKNNHPRFPYLMDVRDFLKLEDLPPEMFNLDILDGSPPCSVFSTAGEREKGWNKEKVFREGQAKQKLDDLFFWFIRIAERLQPKVVIAENVSGLLKGNAKGYVNEIFKAYDAAGYKVQLFLLNAAFMGVPQKRERCFFITHRKDLEFPKLKLSFNEKPILFGEVRSEHGMELGAGIAKQLLQQRTEKDKCMADISLRVRGKNAGFNDIIIHDADVANTLRSAGNDYRMCDGKRLTDRDCINIQTFPQDYDFSPESAKYICGMSVPPVMMAQIASEVYRQWLGR